MIKVDNVRVFYINKMYYFCDNDNLKFKICKCINKFDISIK